MKWNLGAILNILPILAATFLLGLIPIIVKSSALDGLILALGRVSFAVLSLPILKFFAKMKLCKFSENKFHLTLFGFFHAFTIFYYFLAIKLISTAMAVLLLWAGAIYLVVLSRLFHKVKIEKKEGLSLSISIIGLIWILCTADLASNWQGYLAGFLAGFLMAWVFLIGDIVRKEYDQFSMIFYQNMIALPMMSLLMILFMLHSQFTIAIPSTDVSTDVLFLVVLGVICTTVSFYLLYSGMKKLNGGQNLGFLLSIEIALPIVLASIKFDEIPTCNEAIGGALIFLGFMIIRLLPTKGKRKDEEKSYDKHQHQIYHNWMN